MDIVALVVSSANLAFCAWRTLQSLLKLRVIAIAWLLITYHGVFLIQLIIEGPFSQYRGFTNDYTSVSADTLSYLAWFVLAFNVLFAVAESGMAKLVVPRASGEVIWRLPDDARWLLNAQWIFAAFLAIGGVLYWFKMAGAGYRDYVEYRQSNWPQVFLWSSAPLIAILALRGKRALAFAACLPFLFFAVYLKIRAFALLSIIPVVVVIFFQSLEVSAARRRNVLRPLVFGAVLFAFLVAVSIVVTYKKAADIGGLRDAPGQITGLPDSGMIYGSALIFEYVRDTKVTLGPDALVQYGWNMINPFMRLIGQRPPAVTDPAVYMATIIDGVPKGSAVFFHYPTLWYGDAILAFGLSGLLLALLWGSILSFWEGLMTRNSALLALLLPYYTWHAYMLVRGTPAGSTVPLAYAAYISVLVFLVVAQFRFLKRLRRGRRQWR